MLRWSNKRHRLLLRWTLASGVVAILVLVGAWVARRPPDEAVLPGERVDGLTSILSQAPPQQRSTIRFVDVTEQAGVAVRHFPDERSSLLPEDMGSGVACGDYDGDGRVDLFFVNFAGSILRSPEQYASAPDARCRLYRNTGDGRFSDVTDSSGTGFIGFGMGAAWGDYDNDGDLDLYVTAFGDNVLYANRGDGTFEDVTAAAGVQDKRFSSGCSWADYDRDGDLDLYVCNYVDFVFRPKDQGVTKLQYGTEQPYTLNPSAYLPQANSLFRNKGDGTFEEVAAAAGVADPEGRSLSASWVDFDNDGWVDLYVANDVSSNGVFRNSRDGAFEDIGADSLAADYRGAMGIAVSDFDNDMDQDALITHWIAQENALFKNMLIDERFKPENSATAGKLRKERLWFLDSADQVGLGQKSLDVVGWATAFGDLDNDGFRDLWIVNGSTFEQPSNHRLLRPQRSFLFWNVGDGSFVDIAGQASEALTEPFVGRGGAQLDFDRDGRLDLVIVRNSGRGLLLRNTTTKGGHWLGVSLRQTGGNTSAYGARVYVSTRASTQMEELGAGSSYLSQNDSMLHFGLGEPDKIDRLRIVWPDGSEEVHEDLLVDRVVSFDHAATYPVRPPP